MEDGGRDSVEEARSRNAIRENKMVLVLRVQEWRHKSTFHEQHWVDWCRTKRSSGGTQQAFDPNTHGISVLTAFLASSDAEGPAVDALASEQKKRNHERAGARRWDKDPFSPKSLSGAKKAYLEELAVYKEKARPLDPHREYLHPIMVLQRRVKRYYTGDVFKESKVQGLTERDVVGIVYSCKRRDGKMNRGGDSPWQCTITLPCEMRPGGLPPMFEGKGSWLDRQESAKASAAMELMRLLEGPDISEDEVEFEDELSLEEALQKKFETAQTIDLVSVSDDEDGDNGGSDVAAPRAADTRVPPLHDGLSNVKIKIEPGLVCPMIVVPSSAAESAPEQQHVAPPTPEMEVSYSSDEEGFPDPASDAAVQQDSASNFRGDDDTDGPGELESSVEDGEIIDGDGDGSNMMSEALDVSV
jgi:hypothetical protein